MILVGISNRKVSTKKKKVENNNVLVIGRSVYLTAE